MALPEKITELRRKQGWSQEELAERLDISRQSVSKWESGASVPELDKVIKLSRLFGVTTDFLLTDGNPPAEGHTQADCEPTEREVSAEEAEAFLALTRSICGKTALGVCLCILSPVLLIILAGLAERQAPVLTEQMAVGLGTAWLLVMVTAGVVLLIMNGMKLSPYEYLEKEPIVLPEKAYRLLEEQNRQFAGVFRIRVAVGVALCIAGVIPLMVAAGLGASDMTYLYCVCLILLFVAGGVFLFVRYGMLHSAYHKLLQIGDYTKEDKAVAKQLSGFSAVYWCGMTAVYLAVSLITGRWDLSWIIWPVAGVLFGGIYAVLAAVKKGKS